MSKEKTKRAIEAIDQRRTPILAAIIGVTATVIPVLISSIASQFDEEPAIEIDITPLKREDDRGAEITVTNNGSAPATNLTIFVNAPENITNADEDFSTVGSISLNYSGARLEAGIPKLVHGSGSVVKLDVSTGQIQSSGSYLVYVTYDQGSNMKKYPTNPYTDLAAGLRNGFARFVELLFSPIGVISLIAVSLIYLLFFLRYVRNRRIKALTTIAIRQIHEDITEVHRVLSKNNRSSEIISTIFDKVSPEIRDPTSVESERIADIVGRFMHLRLRRIDPQDFLILDDFYHTTRNRNKIIPYEKEYSAIEKMNRECLDLAEKALRNIRWEKYNTMDLRAEF